MEIPASSQVLYSVDDATSNGKDTFPRDRLNCCGPGLSGLATSVSGRSMDAAGLESPSNRGCWRLGTKLDGGASGATEPAGHQTPKPVGQGGAHWATELTGLQRLPELQMGCHGCSSWSQG